MEDFKNVLKKYKKAKNWLLSLIEKKQSKTPLSQKSILELHKQKLERTKRFLEFLGNPQNSYKSIHIAGTSGKGSTALILSRLLEASGFKVGLHIKPYLQEPIEKLVINSKMIAPSKFVKLVSFLKTKYEVFKAAQPSKLIPRYGEIWVVLTHLYFSQEKVDFGIIETGVGGRFSVSNILNPEISIITTVGYDHVKTLGPTLKDIAWHKAGIIKKTTPVVVGQVPKEAWEVIKKEAKGKKAQIYKLGKDFKIHIKSTSQEGAIFDLKTPFKGYKNIKISLLGRYQAQNCACALVAWEILKNKYNFKDINLNSTLSNLSFPGRMEIVQKNPLVILDGAHNPQKMRALSETVKEIFQKKRLILVLGLLSYKNAGKTLEPIAPLAKAIILTEPQVYGKESLPAKEFAKHVKKFFPEIENLYTEPDPKKAVKLALERASKEDLILITGSIYLVGNARELWHPSKKLLWEAEKDGIIE